MPKKIIQMVLKNSALVIALLMTVQIQSLTASNLDSLLSALAPISMNNANQLIELRLIKGPDDGIASLALSPNGAIIAIGNYKDNCIYVLNVATNDTVATLTGHTAAVTSLVFSPDGALLASTGTVNLPPDRDGTLRIWDIKAGKQLAVFETPGISNFAFSQDGKWLAGSGIGDPLPMVWNVKSLSKKEISRGAFANVGFHPNGILLATASRDPLVHIINVETGEEVSTFIGHEGWISAIAFSPDGKKLASGSDDTTIKLWDLETGKMIKELIEHSSEIEFLAFNPDGSVLASLGSGTNIQRTGGQISISIGPSDKFLRFWNVETGDQVKLLENTDEIDQVSFNSDWRLLATAHEKGIIRIWGVKK